MKIAYKDILNYIDGTLPEINEISDKLFQLGHEHSIKDEIFDIEFTPNRGDCLSVFGLVRDLGIFYKIKNKENFYKTKIAEFDFDFENKAENFCPSISFLKINIKSTPRKYKDYLENYFINLDNKKINFFTDVSNYLAYEIGQPTHCYDFEKINGKLVLEEINEDKKFVNLLNDEMNLNGKNYIFSMKSKPINLAGIMGGNSTACSYETKSALIESAYFRPEFIIGKTVKYNINSEAAYKFERGVDPLLNKLALMRFINIVDDHAEIEKVELCSKIYHSEKSKEIIFDPSKIDSILGIEIDEDYYRECFTKLGFKINNNKITVPSHRHDVSNHNDLAEEACRAIGFDNIKKTKFDISSFKKVKSSSKESYLKKMLITNGFHEVINQPFVSDSFENALKVDNPLDQNKSYLRTSLKKSLLENLVFNENRQKDCIKLFEISDVYTKNNDIIKEKKVGIIASGIVGKNYHDFKKRINTAYLNNVLKSISNNESFDIEVIPREIVDSKINNEIIYFEMPIDSLNIQKINLKKKKITFKNLPIFREVSEFPSTYRDLSFASKNIENIKNLESLIDQYSHEYLKEKFIFDYFVNQKTHEVKIGYRFVFQSLMKTLTDKEVEAIRSEIINLAYSIEGIVIPGIENK